MNACSHSRLSDSKLSAIGSVAEDDGIEPEMDGINAYALFSSSFPPGVQMDILKTLKLELAKIALIIAINA